MPFTICKSCLYKGLAYLQTLFEQMSTAQDTVRRLFIVAAARQIPER